MRFKVAKHQLTPLIYGNAVVGDFVAKPMLLFQSLNPLTLKGKNKSLRRYSGMGDLPTGERG